MKNKHLQFIIIPFFIFYSLIFTFLNEPLFSFAEDFDYFLKKNLNLNSDVIVPYSFNRDLISGISLKGWSHSPSYDFLGIIFSFFPTLIAPNLDFYIFFISPLQILFFGLVLAYLQRNDYNFLKNFSNILLSFFLFFLLLKFFDIFYYLLNINSYISFFLEQIFHIVGSHSLSGSISVLMYYYYFCYEKSKQNDLIFYLLFFTFSFSDIWFSVYFLSFYGFVFLSERKIKNIKVIFILILLAILAILITYFLNPNLKIHIINKFFFDGEKKVESSFLDPTIITFSLFLILSILFLYLKKNKKLPKNYEPLFYGSVLVHMFNLTTGLMKDFYSVKYSSVIIPVTAMFLLVYLRGIKNVLLNIFTIIACSTTLLLFLYAFKKENNIFNVYKEEVACIKNIKNYEDYNLVSSYWPGKVIFEKLNRKNNFFQISYNMAQYHWINNTAWEKMNKSDDKFQNYFLIADGIDQNIISKFGSVLKIKPFCNNKIYIVENIDLKFTKNSIEFNQK